MPTESTFITRKGSVNFFLRTGLNVNEFAPREDTGAHRLAGAAWR